MDYSYNSVVEKEMKNLLLVIIPFLLLACSSGKDKPDDVLSKDKMVNVLLDIHLAEARVSQARLPLDSSLNYYIFLENEIFQKHQIDSATYKKSMDYYTLHIRELDEIYESVLDSLNIKSAEGSRTDN
jgi:hypothetical protein